MLRAAAQLAAQPGPHIQEVTHQVLGVGWAAGLGGANHDSVLARKAAQQQPTVGRGAQKAATKMKLLR
jgi:hypothetical protein